MKVKRFFWDYLYFTQTERFGVVFLLAICLSVFLVPGIYSRFFSRQTMPDTGPQVVAANFIEPVEEQKIEAAKSFFFNPNTATDSDFRAMGLSEKTAKSILNYRSKGGKFKKPADFSKIYTLQKKDFERLLPWIKMDGAPVRNSRDSLVPAQTVAVRETKAPPAPFDPNTADRKTLQQAGLPERSINGWLKYVEKGGKFRYKEDLKKLWSLSEDDYENILPFVMLPEKDGLAVAPQTHYGSNAAARYRPIDINTAGTSDWVQLPGIGEGWARKIMGFREKLGGFSSVEQVAETRYLPDSVFMAAKPYLQWTAPPTRQIALNTASWSDLVKHPYVEARHAQWIVAYREQHGPFQSVDELLKILEIKPDWLEKMRPYLVL